LRFAIQVWHDSGAYQIMSSAHAVLAALLVQLGRYESAATLSAAGDSPFASATYPEFQATITTSATCSATIGTNHLHASVPT